MTWIDTHAHIYADAFKGDRDEMLERARSSGVTEIYMPNVDHTSIDAMLEVESRWQGCYAMMGLHPCSVKKGFERELYVVEEWLSKRKFVAVGEIGTDLYWDKTFWDQQCEAFRIQVSWAKQFGIPVVIHCRESMDQTIEMVEQLQDGNLSGIFHCFTGDYDQALKAIDFGFYLGIGGVVTFKNAGLDKVVKDIPLEHIVLETDSPYLAPVPFRGKENESSYLLHIAQKVADLHHLPLEDIAAITTQNSKNIFGV